MKSVSVDEERAPFVKLAFELYASGDHTLDDIASELTARGLITRGNVRRAPGPVSINKVAQMLRDRYYLGKVAFIAAMRGGLESALSNTEAAQRLLRKQLEDQLINLETKEENLLDLAADANEEVVGDEINSPLAEILAVQHGFRAQEARLNKVDSIDQAIAELMRHSAQTTRATPKGGSCAVTVEDLLTGIDVDADFSEPSMVDPRRFELLTSSMRTRRATNCAKGP